MILIQVVPIYLKIEPWTKQKYGCNIAIKMKENIPAYISLCNKTILKWYQINLPKTHLHEFTPVDSHNKDVINNIYDMWTIMKSETKTKECLLLPIVKYYFAISVVEYYVLYEMDSFFNNAAMTKYMVDFSTNPALSECRKKMLGFNQQPYVFKNIHAPYKLNIQNKKTCATRL